MDDLKLVEEFLSKKNLDGVDKFLLEKYMGAIENVKKQCEIYKRMYNELVMIVNTEFISKRKLKEFLESDK